MGNKPWDLGEEISPDESNYQGVIKSENVYFPEFKYAIGAPCINIGERRHISSSQEGGRNYPGINELFEG